MIQLRTFCRNQVLKLSAVLLFTSSTAWANAGLTLDNQKSILNFVTTKAINVGEVHRFDQLSGSVNDEGEANLDIDLSSVDTGIPIRDQRMQNFLFETDRFPAASLHTSVPMEQLRDLKSGEMKSMTLEGNFGIHGLKLPVTAPVRVIKLADGSLQVDSAQPLLLHAKDLGLVEGVEKLREIAGLPSIGQTVAVTFSLNFRP